MPAGTEEAGMDWHGTPRFQNGPPEEKPSFQFKNSTEAYDYIIKRGRTPEQLAKLVAGAQMGHAIASVMQLVKDNLWVVQQRGPVSKPEVDDLASEATFIRQRPPAISTALATSIKFADLGIEMVEATKRLVVVAKKMRAFFDRNPNLEENLGHWRSPLQMMAALTIYTASEEKLLPPLGHREMEAVALLVGYRPPEEEFPKKEKKEDEIENDFKKTERQEENWRKLMKKVEEELLPVLRGLEPVEIAEVVIGSEQKAT